MNRGAIAYVVTPLGVNHTPFIAIGSVKETSEGFRWLLDDGGSTHWFPWDGYATAEETDDDMTLSYSAEGSHFGETGILIQPVTVDRWNELCKLRPEMKPVFDFDDLVSRFTGMGGGL